MSANELLEKVKALPARERRKFLEGVHELEDSFAPSPPRLRRRPAGSLARRCGAATENFR
jgi:hypothetical protein